MLLRIRIILFICFFPFNILLAQTAGNDSIKTELGFRLIPDTQSNMITFAVITHRDGKILSSRVISYESFVLRSLGIENSEANPDKKNFFKEFGVPRCFYDIDYNNYLIEAKDTACITAFDLWKLRYSRDPNYSKNMQLNENDQSLIGWANEKYHPSWGQIQILQRYGVVNDTDFFCGPNAYRLFRDICDEEWLLNYKHTQ
jgi:hypothetical protein